MGDLLDSDSEDDVSDDGYFLECIIIIIHLIRFFLIHTTQILTGIKR